MMQGISVVDRDKAAYGGTLCFYSCEIASISGTIVVCTQESNIALSCQISRNRMRVKQNC